MASPEPEIVFLVGAGRSGSTLVYKTLCLHPDVGYISSAVASMPTWPALAALNRVGRHRIELKRWAWFEDSGQAHGVQRTLLRKLVPMPREGEGLYAKAGVPLFPPDDFAWTPRSLAKVRRRFEALARWSGGKVFVSKRIANNRRLALLNAAFPNAQAP